MQAIELDLISSNILPATEFAPSELESRTGGLFGRINEQAMNTGSALVSSIGQLKTSAVNRIHQFFYPDAEIRPLNELHEVILETPSTSKVNEKVNGIFERTDTFLDATETAANWGALVTSVQDFSESAIEYLQDLNGPLQLLILAKETREVASGILGTNQDLIENPSKIAMLGCSIISRLSSLAAFLQFSIIGAACLLISSIIGLGTNLFYYTSATKLLIAVLKFIVAVLSIYLILHISVPVHILLLILWTSTLFLSATAGSQ